MRDPGWGQGRDEEEKSVCIDYSDNNSNKTGKQGPDQR